VRAEEPTKQHRIAIVIGSGPIARINDPASRNWQAFWEELRRLGDVDGQNLSVECYSGEGRREAHADLAREAIPIIVFVKLTMSGPYDIFGGVRIGQLDSLNCLLLCF
jgi:hypothetical protein